MTVTINNLNWEIKELSQDEIIKIMKERAEKGLEEMPGIGRYWGSTLLDEQIIILDRDLPQDRKRRTLLHELAHAYIGCYITHLSDTKYSEEMVCDIISNSFDIIKNMVERYEAITTQQNEDEAEDRP